MIARVWDGLDDRPERGIGTNRQSDVGTSSHVLDGRDIAGTMVGDEGDDEENCEEESSNHEHHD